jgi:hypothetical protein
LGWLNPTIAAEPRHGCFSLVVAKPGRFRQAGEGLLKVTACAEDNTETVVCACVAWFAREDEGIIGRRQIALTDVVVCLGARAVSAQKVRRVPNRRRKILDRGGRLPKPQVDKRSFLVKLRDGLSASCQRGRVVVESAPQVPGALTRACPIPQVGSGCFWASGELLEVVQGFVGEVLLEEHRGAVRARFT